MRTSPTSRVESLISESWKSTSSILGRELKMRISHYRKKQIVYDLTRLPGMIVDADCIHCFEIPESQPNFITEGCVRAPVQPISAKESNPHELVGKIALIENADPGFDWIFGAGIVGLVTQYGGAASHMAIRSAELQLPAAIGCGQLIFEQVAGAEFVELDCKGRQIRKIR
jgi:hypothetical protein